VERALDLLATFSTTEPELTLAELSSRLNLSASTTYRLLVTLENRRYVEHNHQNGGYTLGVACLDLGTVFLVQLDLRERVVPVLEALRDQCRETVHLGILDHKAMEVIYVQKLDALLPIGMMGSKVGGRVRADCTGLGRCMLAHMPLEAVREFYTAKGLSARTPNTITDVDRLMQVLIDIKRQGYAIDCVEHELGVKCVAAPVWNHREAVVGAISVSGPEQRMDHLIAESNLVEKLRATAHEASVRMGYPGGASVRP
jgi:DNA-binding IclR family transcriptional regulator